MTTHHFTEVQAYRKRSGMCPACGKRVTRSRTFAQTVNPFRSDLKGDLGGRTPHQVVNDAVQAEADAWVPDFRHEGCKP